MTDITIPGYRVVKELGHGGMSTVYLAVQESLDRQVALKVMAPALAANRSFGDRFEREGKTVAQLRHAGVLAIYDIGVSDHQYYMAMEFIAGGNLKQRLRNGPLAQGACLEVLAQIAEALDYAHSKGFIHRDVKSENILFREDGTVVLSDFGIAKAVGSGSNLTGAGLAIGTPHYMSPEQAKGKPIDHRADLYSLGVVFYEMLTGKVMFEAEDSIAIAYAHVHNPIPELLEELKEYQPLLNQLIAKDPEKRYASAKDLVADIYKLQGAAQPPSRKLQPVVLPEDDNDGPRAIHLVSKTVLASTINIEGDGENLGLTEDISKVERAPDVLQEKKTPFFEPETAINRNKSKTPLVLGIIFFLMVVGGVSAKFLVATDGAEPNPPKPPVKDILPSPQGQEPTQKKTVDSQEQEIARLLESAEENLKKSRLTNPPGENAFENFQDILVLDAKNKHALQGIKNIGTKYLHFFDTNLKRENFKKAESYLTKAEKILGETSEITGRRKKLLLASQKPDTSPQPEVEVVQPVTQEKPPASFDQLMEEGSKLLEDNNKASAAKLFLKALDLRPNDTLANILYRKATNLYRDGERFKDSLRGSNLQGPEMVMLDAKSFIMGDIKKTGGGDEKPIHEVTFNRSFAISKYEITFEDFDKFCIDTNRSKPADNGWGRGRIPVVNVSWEDAKEYTRWLTNKTGQKYRLPTEAEWEYAARAKTTTSYWWGEKFRTGMANCDGCGSPWDNLQPAPVGEFEANKFGLFDMTGNVWEWCADDYHANYYGAPSDGSKRVSQGSQKVYRGGSFLFKPENQRVSFRNYGKQSYSSKDVGFRVVREK